MIPPLVEALCGAPKVLPVGIHLATLSEIQQMFGWNERRKLLLAGLDVAISDLRAVNCRRIYLAGSFVTAEAQPGDFDGCWDPAGVNTASLHEMYKDRTAQNKILQKLHHEGELWSGNHQIPGFDGLIKFFQTDTRRGIPQKGILAISIA